MKITLTIEGASAVQMAAVFAAIAKVEGASDGALSKLGVHGGAGGGAAGNNVVSLPVSQQITIPTVPPTITGVPEVVGEVPEPVNAAAPAFDSSGLPWDGRIHAASKAVTSDGKWRKRRGVGDDLVAGVEAELRNRVGAGVPSAPVAPPVPPAPVVGVPTAAVPMPPMPPMPPSAPTFVPPPPMAPGGAGSWPQPPVPLHPAPSAPTMPPEILPPPATGAIDFPTFMQHISMLMNNPGQNGKQPIDAAYLVNLTQRIGAAFGEHLNAITDVAAKPAMITTAVQFMQADNRW